MLSTVYVACLLAASAVATPAHHAPRSFASYSQDAAHADENQNLQASSGPFGSSMSQAYSKNSAASHNSGTAYNGGVGFGGGLDGAVGYGGIDSGYGGQAAFGNAQGGYNAMSANANSYNAMSSNTNGFNAGGLGGYASGGSSFSSTQQSSSISSVSSSFQSLNGMIGGLQSQLASGQLTRAVAFQQCQRLAQYFQSVLAQANQCGACFDGQGQFGSVASSTMSQFTSFMSQLQSTFGANAYGQIASPFSNLSSSFQQFFQRSSSSSSFSSTSIVPQNFGPVMQPIMPTLMPTLQQLDPNSFPLGGLGGYSAGGGSFSSTQQSSSVSSVSSGFQSLNGMIGGLQSQLAAGQLTRAVAFQQCQRLAQYFQSVLTQANRCGTCFEGQGQFGSVASSTMSQFTSFMSQLQSSFGANAYGQIASPFATLSSSFQQFFQRSSSSSSFSSTSIIPQNFGPVMQPIMPTLMPALQQLAFHKK